MVFNFPCEDVYQVMIRLVSLKRVLRRRMAAVDSKEVSANAGRGSGERIFREKPFAAQKGVGYRTRPISNTI